LTAAASLVGLSRATQSFSPARNRSVLPISRREGLVMRAFLKGVGDKGAQDGAALKRGGP